MLGRSVLGAAEQSKELRDERLPETSRCITIEHHLSTEFRYSCSVNLTSSLP